MAISVNYQDYSREMLLKELKELHLQYELLKSSYEKYAFERGHIEELLLKRTELLAAFNRYSIDLSNLENSKVYQFIVNEFKKLFNVRGVWISRYDEKLSELVIEASTVSDEDNSVLIKHLGKTVRRLRTPLNFEQYKLIMESGISAQSSLHDISFGYIPELAGSVIEKLFGIGWFQAIALTDKRKMFGTLVVAGHKDQEPIIRETLLAFTEITSNILRRLYTEEKLSVSEEKFRKAFITSPDAVNINRLEDGMYVLINEGFTKLTGYSEDDVIGKTSIELNIWAFPSDRDKLISGLRENGVVENLEADFVMKDGGQMTGMMSATIIELNNVPHILSITRDITDKKKTAIALQKSESRYRELIELAVDGILLGESDGTITGANSYILNLTGRTLDQILGINIATLFPAMEMERVPLRYSNLRQGETIINERNILRPDGRMVPIEMHTKMMPDGTYQSIFHDITGRKAAEKALRESEAWFRNLFEQSSDGIFYISYDGKIIMVNRSFAEMHGYTLEEILKMNILDLDCPESKIFFHDRMRRLKEGENLKFEVKHYHRDGHKIPMEVIANRITVGSANYIMAAHRDITDRLKIEEAMKIAREKAETSDKLKTSFLNNISHEVRTPLNGILGFAEIMAQDDLSYAGKQEALAMVNESGYRLLDTITNYMDISLLISGEMIVKKRMLSPDQLLKELYLKFRPACEAKNIELSLCLPGSSDKLFVNSDNDLLIKIFTQLLNNAVKFTEKGTIQFGYSKLDSKLEFFVSDTGIGIGEEFIENLFNHFVKEERIKTRPNEGSGLGLSVSKGLVGLLGEDLIVDSEKGKGSKFYFSIPLINKTYVPSGINDAGLSRQSDRVSTILVAEDDATSFLYIKTILGQSTSAKIIHAANGREAIEKFSNNPGIDIVLMDMKMPEINGIEATLEIKAINPSIPVIAITAYAMVGDEKRILEAGCDSYISKPLNKKVLLDKLAEFITI